jgi:hypothetical protein
LPATPLASRLDLQEQAMLTAFVEDVGAFPAATRYWIDVQVEFDPRRERGAMVGTVRVRFTNDQLTPLEELVFMLWPNHEQYRAEMDAGPALVDGRLVAPDVEPGGIARRYPLPKPLGPGDSIDMSVSFSLETSGPIGSRSPRRFGITEGVLFAPTFYPIVPRLQDGKWMTQDAPLAGDTTNSEVAFYEVRVTTDAEHVVVATGTEIDSRLVEDGSRTLTFVSGPARDFAVALGPFLSETVEVAGVQVTGWVIPEHEADLVRMVEAAGNQMEILSDRIGPYPYLELDLVDVPGAFGGIEYPGLVSVGTVGGPGLIFPTVHEVGHQWFYGLIGDDQLQEPWLDEAAATYTEVLYYEEVFGAGTATGLLADFREQVMAHPNANSPIGLPVDGYDSQREYGLFVYLKGALFFDALRLELGDELFFRFLQDYYESFRYQIATAADFQAAAERTCGCDLDELFDLWVYAGGSPPGF